MSLMGTPAPAEEGDASNTEMHNPAFLLSARFNIAFNFSSTESGISKLQNRVLDVLVSMIDSHVDSRIWWKIQARSSQGYQA